MDPTAGPKLIKCEKRPLPGRQDPKEPPDPVDYNSILPDLENDDMFARRTLAFQSNTDMALMKTRLCPHRTPRHLYSSDPELNIVVQPRHLQDLVELPDIELDDVAYRTAAQAQAQAQQRPLSGAPDNYAPMPIPEPWALPPDLQARLLCPPCPLAHQKEADKNQKEEEEVCPRPKTDDMLLRKLGSVVLVQPASQRGSRMALSPSLPTSCSEGDLLKMQAIREASQLRFKRKLLAEKLAALRS